jgi:hypothetical protein
VDVVAAALLAADRPLAEFAATVFRRRGFAVVIILNMTDQSVIFKMQLHANDQSAVMLSYLFETA